MKNKEKSYEIKNSLPSAYCMVLSCMFMMTGYELLRSSSSALLKDAYGAENFVFAMAAIPVFITAVLVFYNKALNKFGTKATLFLTIAISQICLGVLYLCILKGYSIASLALYLFREIYIVLFVEQVWSFLNTILEKTTAKKLYGKFLAVTTMGALFGDVTVYSFAGTWGAKHMIGLSCICFIPALFFAYLAYKKAPAEYQKHTKAKAIKGEGFGLDLFTKEPTLVVIILFVFSSQAYGTFMTLNYETSLHQALPNVNEQAAFAGMIFGGLHIMGLLSQIFVVPFVMRRFSSLFVHTATPCVHFICLFLMLLFPGLKTAMLCFVVFKVFDYSLFKVAKELLYIPLSLEANYRAKEFIDVLGYRCTKGFVSIGLSCCKKIGLSMSILHYNVFGFSALALWAYAATVFRRQEQLRIKPGAQKSAQAVT
jgi:ATP:ADP antiporter, AAA family